MMAVLCNVPEVRGAEMDHSRGHDGSVHSSPELLHLRSGRSNYCYRGDLPGTTEMGAQGLNILETWKNIEG